MTTTLFAPTPNLPFQFQATLSGSTVNVTSTGTTFNVSIPWNTYGQRFYVQITDQNGNLVLNKPLIASPPGYPISIVAGYFASTLVFWEAIQTFEVSP